MKCNDVLRKPAARKLALVVVGLALWISSSLSARAAQSVTLAWNASSDPSVAGYVIYYGRSSGSYSNRLDVGLKTTGTIPGLKEGSTNFITLTAYNAAKVESTPAGEVAFIAPGVVALTPGAKSSDPVNVTFPVAPGHWYELQASARPDLKLWTTVWKTPVQSSNIWLGYQDRQSPILVKRFYRVVLH